MRVSPDEDDVELISLLRVVQPGDATDFADVAVVAVGEVSQCPSTVDGFVWVGNVTVVNAELLVVRD